MSGERDAGVTAGRLARGAAAGVVASVVQAAVGKAEDLAFLPPWEDSDIAPRLVDRVARRVGIVPSPAEEWTLGTAFHLGYAAWWGGVYAVSRERLRLNPVAGGVLLGGLIYGITFPRWGAAVQTGTERPPAARTRRMEVVAVSVTLSFGLCAALLYERIR